MFQFTRTTLVLHWVAVSVYLAGSTSGQVAGALTKKDHQRSGNVIVTEQTLANLTAKFPYYLGGYDYEDRPILVIQWGKWDLRLVAEGGGKMVKDFEDALDGFGQIVKDGYFDRKLPNNSEPLTKGEFVGFGDYTGMDLRQLASIPSVKLAIKSLIQLAHLNKEYTYGFVVNANTLAHHVINFAKPYMGTTLEKTEIYGTNRRYWIPKVLKKLPRSQLHPAYGGDRDFQPVNIFSVM